jgi:tRNA(adenine34) deaminase
MPPSHEGEPIANYEAWMRLALTQAQLALPVDIPVGAVVVDRRTNRIIATGYNTRERNVDPLGHAELNALRQAASVLGNWRLNHCTLVVTLEPCPMCASAISQSRLHSVVYGAIDSQLGGCGGWVVEPSQRPTPVGLVGGVLEEHCQQLLQAFFKAKRLKPG